MKYVYWNDDEFVEACKTSISMAGVMKVFRVPTNGEAYRKFKRDVKRLGISTTHFLGKASQKGVSHKFWGARDPSTIFLENNPVDRLTVKKALLRLGVAKVCAICTISSWLNKPLSLQLDHMNGDGDDNRIHNLRLLCPNCHSQTETFGGRNKKKLRDYRNHFYFQPE